jgi:hypothetical protein
MSQVLRALALIPIAAGLASVVFGTEIVRGGGASNPNVESELRYYAAFYVGFGVYLWSIAPDIERRGRELRLAAAVLFCGGLARLVGVLADGWPEADYVVLMVVELVLPLVLVTWQRSIAAQEDERAR